MSHGIDAITLWNDREMKPVITTQKRSIVKQDTKPGHSHCFKYGIQCSFDGRGYCLSEKPVPFPHL